MGEKRVRGANSLGLTGCTDVVYHEIAGETVASRAAKHQHQLAPQKVGSVQVGCSWTTAERQRERG